MPYEIEDNVPMPTGAGRPLLPITAAIRELQEGQSFAIPRIERYTAYACMASENKRQTKLGTRLRYVMRKIDSEHNRIWCVLRGDDSEEGIL